MGKTIGIGVVIIGIAMLIAAVATAVMNFITLKWALEICKPFDKVVKKSAPLMEKMLTYADKELDDALDD